MPSLKSMPAKPEEGAVGTPRDDDVDGEPSGESGEEADPPPPPTPLPAQTPALLRPPGPFLVAPPSAPVAPAVPPRSALPSLSNDRNLRTSAVATATSAAAATAAAATFSTGNAAVAPAALRSMPPNDHVTSVEGGGQALVARVGGGGRKRPMMVATTEASSSSSSKRRAVAAEHDPNNTPAEGIIAIEEQGGYDGDCMQQYTIQIKRDPETSSFGLRTYRLQSAPNDIIITRIPPSLPSDTPLRLYDKVVSIGSSGDGVDGGCRVNVEGWTQHEFDATIESLRGAETLILVGARSCINRLPPPLPPAAFLSTYSPPEVQRADLLPAAAQRESSAEGEWHYPDRDHIELARGIIKHGFGRWEDIWSDEALKLGHLPRDSLECRGTESDVTEMVDLLRVAFGRPGEEDEHHRDDDDDNDDKEEGDSPVPASYAVIIGGSKMGQAMEQETIEDEGNKVEVSLSPSTELADLAEAATMNDLEKAKGRGINLAQKAGASSDTVDDGAMQDLPTPRSACSDNRDGDRFALGDKHHDDSANQGNEIVLPFPVAGCIECGTQSNKDASTSPGDGFSTGHTRAKNVLALAPPPRPLSIAQPERSTQINSDASPSPGDGPTSTSHRRRPTWEERFNELAEYVETHGRCSVPPQRGSKLGSWAQVQRSQYRLKKNGKKSSLTDAREADLERIGFVWNLGQRSELMWEERFNELAEYIEMHGHCSVPRKGSKLGKWVDNQRSTYRLKKNGKTSSLTDAREADLERIGFVW